jgi:hypothetical protein
VPIVGHFWMQFNTLTAYIAFGRLIHQVVSD